MEKNNEETIKKTVSAAEKSSKHTKLQEKLKDQPPVVQFLAEYWPTLLTIIYVISPIDLIPESLVPIIGVADDLLLVVIEGRRLIKKRNSNT